MKTVLYPNSALQQQLLQRPQQQKSQVEAAVNTIIDRVKKDGDTALKSYAIQFDNAVLENLQVTMQEIQQAATLVDTPLKAAIQTAFDNIYKFHKACFTQDYPVVETMPGITCWRKSLPIKKVGLYIPGGSAPLFSTVLMLAVPAKIAGNERVILCSPTDSSGNINPVVLYTANLCGVTEIYKVGGAGAIAAMTYGTDSIPAVDKIFGPGNAFVTRAKELAQQAGVAIDMPAGPSEVLIIADQHANPAFVAADLLAQAEHGADSQVILLTDSVALSDAVNEQLSLQLSSLSRKLTTAKALENSTTIVLTDIAACVNWSDVYAPEHLIINTTNADEVAQQIQVAGSIFIGSYTCESLGDYASGTNHTLPTYGYARNYSGVSVDSFVNKVTYQKATAQGIKNLGPAVELMATAEGLDAHKNAVSVRLRELEKTIK
jgi:histidinol dehydrogenase